MNDFDLTLLTEQDLKYFSAKSIADVHLDEADDLVTPMGTYCVVTQRELDELVDESLDSYIDDCVFGDIPENSPARNYFDEKAFKRDCRYDGEEAILGCSEFWELSCGLVAIKW